MWASILLTFFLPLLAAADESGADGVQKEQERLQGEWMLMQPVFRIDKSPPQDPCSQPNWAFAKGKLRFFYPASLRSFEETEFGADCPYQLDPGKEPKQIDLTVSGGKWAGKTLKGIYLLQGDVLMIALSTDENKRPREFKSGSESGQRLLIFQHGSR